MDDSTWNSKDLNSERNAADKNEAQNFLDGNKRFFGN